MYTSIPIENNVKSGLNVIRLSLGAWITGNLDFTSCLPIYAIINTDYKVNTAYSHIT